MFSKGQYRIIKEGFLEGALRWLIGLLAALIGLIICITFIGCSGLKVERDKEGRVTSIKQTGPFPVEGKIGDAELSTKVSLFEMNLGVQNKK